MLFTALLVLAGIIAQTESHMSLQEPPARNVMWRMGFQLPPHADDDYLICTESRGAPCPPVETLQIRPPPHPHEGGGKWATGIITRSYTMGQKIKVHVNVTRSHGGFLEFKLCPHNKVSKPVSQSCLDAYPLEVIGQRSRKVKISAPYDAPEMLTFQLQLPVGVTCDQCVLQMSNTAEQFKPQTIMFRNCADIAIEGNAKTSFAAGQPEAARDVNRQPVFPRIQPDPRNSQPSFSGGHALLFPNAQPAPPATQPPFISSRFGGPPPGFPAPNPPSLIHPIPCQNRSNIGSSLTGNCTLVRSENSHQKYQAHQLKQLP